MFMHGVFCALVPFQHGIDRVRIVTLAEIIHAVSGSIEEVGHCSHDG